MATCSALLDQAQEKLDELENATDLPITSISPYSGYQQALKFLKETLNKLVEQFQNDKLSAEQTLLLWTNHVSGQQENMFEDRFHGWERNSSDRATAPKWEEGWTNFDKQIYKTCAEATEIVKDIVDTCAPAPRSNKGGFRRTTRSRASRHMKRSRRGRRYSRKH